MTKPTPKAYSYIRFSTPEQALGNSLRRQVDEADQYAREVLKMPIDERFADKGISGYKLRNVHKGALGLFLDRISQGEVAPGSVLIVESLNRLTRSEPLDAIDLLRKIVTAGIEVVTLHDRQRYSSGSMREIGHLLQAMVLMAGSFKESENKSQWLANAWSAKRRDAEKGVPLTRQVPAWMEVVGIRTVGTKHDWSSAEFRPIKERVKIIQSIYKRRSEGWGRRRIASWLNETKVPVWGRGRRKAKGGWQESYIYKILTSRAVLGEYQPYRLKEGRYSPRIKAGQPIADYYPQVVSHALWHKAQAYNCSAKTRKGRPGNTILTGLVFDQDGAPMHVERKGGGCDYVATSRAFRHNDKVTYRWRLDHLEKCILLCVYGLDWEQVLKVRKPSSDLARKRERSERIGLQLDELDLKIKRLARSLVEGLGAVGDELKRQAEELTAEKKNLTEEKRQADLEIERSERLQAAAYDGGKRIRAEIDIQKKTPEVRQRIAAELRRLIRQIVVWPNGHLGMIDNETSDQVAREALALLPSDRIRRYAKQNHGAIAFELVNGKILAAWVTYRPGARVGRDPEVIGHAFRDREGHDEWTFDNILPHLKHAYPALKAAKWHLVR